MYLLFVVSWLLLSAFSREFAAAGSGAGAGAAPLLAAGNTLLYAHKSIAPVLTIVFIIGAVFLYSLFWETRFISSRRDSSSPSFPKRQEAERRDLSRLPRIRHAHKRTARARDRSAAGRVDRRRARGAARFATRVEVLTPRSSHVTVLTDWSVMYRTIVSGGYMSPREDVSEQRTDQILTAAEQVVADKGLESLRMDDVAERTGLSKGALYLYFKNKNELTLAILERTLQKELRAIEQLPASGADAESALRNFVDTVIGDIQAITRLMPISYSFISMAFRNPFVQRSLKKYLHRYINALIPIIQSGVESGEFRQVDPEEAAIAVAAVVEGTMLLWVYDRSAIDPTRHIRSGLNQLLEGLKRHECG